MKTIKKFNRNLKSFGFSDIIQDSEPEYLESVVKLDDKDNLLAEEKFDNQGELEERNTYNYDGNGKLLEHILFYAVEDATERRVLKRDEKGRVIEEVKMYGADAGDKSTYSYNDKDLLIEKGSYDEEGVFMGREQFIYDDKDSLAEHHKYDADNKLEERSVFVQKEDKSIELLQYDGKDKLVSKTITKLTEDGKEQSSVQTTADGKLISSVDSVFDEKGNVKERHFKDFYSKTMRYEYDDQNRCIMQELFDGSSVLLRKNIYEFDDAGNLVKENTYEMDTTRGGRDMHFETRYEYENS
jgi:hypothetical protein